MAQSEVITERIPVSPSLYARDIVEAHCPVSMDGAEPVVQLGRAAEPGLFQQLLFSAGNLDTGKEHEVKVTNLPSETPESGKS